MTLVRRDSIRDEVGVSGGADNARESSDKAVRASPVEREMRALKTFDEI